MEVKNSEFIAEVQKMVIDGKMDEVFEVVLEYFSKHNDSIILLASKWKRLEEKRRIPLITYDQYELERTNIEQAILAIVRNVDKKKHKSFAIGKAQENLQQKISTTSDFKFLKKIILPVILVLGILVTLYFALSEKIIINEVETISELESRYMEADSLYNVADEYLAAFNLSRELLDNYDKDQLLKELGKDSLKNLVEIRLDCMFQMYFSGEYNYNKENVRREIRFTKNYYETDLVDHISNQLNEN